MGRAVYDGIRLARRNIGLATRICGGTDTGDMQRIVHLLEAAVCAIRQAEAEARSGPVNNSGELRREVMLLKREVACMMRAIDGCSALYRGISVRLGRTTPSYAPPGVQATVAPANQASELLG